MKKLAIISLLILLARCEGYIPSTQALSVIIDATDGENRDARFKHISSHLYKGHSSDGISISLRYVSETRYAPSYEFELPIGDVGLLSNEDARRRKRRMLLSQFKDTLENTKRGLSSQSEIFRLVVDEANKLSKISGRRSILLFSDLKEHSFFSVYKREDLQKLLTSPELVVQEFTDEVSLNENLSGIAIYIVHTPSLEDDKVFTAMIGVYRTILESRGATLVTTRTKRVQIKP